MGKRAQESSAHIARKRKGGPVFIRYFTLLLAIALIGSSANAQLSEQLFITEVMSNSIHPGADDSGIGGRANGDWWELLNASDQTIDMSGFTWDDNDRLEDDQSFSVFPDGFEIAPSETIIILQEDFSSIDVADGFRDAWGLPNELRILSRDVFEDTGPERFSGLSSNGDEVNLYDATGTLVQSVSFGEAIEGSSFAWGFANSDFIELGISTSETNGSITALSNGSGETVELDVASPGTVFGFPLGTNVDIVSLCSQVAAGERTQMELDQALATVGSLRGDADLNGTVSFSDFLFLSGNFGQAFELGMPAQWFAGDFDCDGQINFGDFLILSDNFGKSAGEVSTSTTSPVPEPSSFVLLLLSLAAVPLMRRKAR